MAAQRERSASGAQAPDGAPRYHRRCSRHNWAVQNLGLIIPNAATDAKAPVVVGYGGEWEISTPAGVRKPDVFVIPRQGARFIAEIDPGNPFAVSFDPAELLDL